MLYEVITGFFDNVLTASERYSTSAVLIGRLNRSASGGWAARWYLQVAGTPSAWTDSRQQLEDRITSYNVCYTKLLRWLARSMMGVPCASSAQT